MMRALPMRLRPGNSALFLKMTQVCVVVVLVSFGGGVALSCCVCFFLTRVSTAVQELFDWMSKVKKDRKFAL